MSTEDDDTAGDEVEGTPEADSSSSSSPLPDGTVPGLPSTFPPAPGSPPPGWLPDPSSPDERLRFWDGERWTDRIKGTDETAVYTPSVLRSDGVPARSNDTGCGIVGLILIALFIWLLVRVIFGPGSTPGSNQEVRDCVESLLVVTEDLRGSVDFCENRYGR